jgi:hypothetical protein
MTSYTCNANTVGVQKSKKLMLVAHLFKLKSVLISSPSILAKYDVITSRLGSVV